MRWSLEEDCPRHILLTFFGRTSFWHLVDLIDVKILCYRKPLRGRELLGGACARDHQPARVWREDEGGVQRPHAELGALLCHRPLVRGSMVQDLGMTSEGLGPRVHVSCLHVSI